MDEGSVKVTCARAEAAHAHVASRPTPTVDSLYQGPTHSIAQTRTPLARLTSHFLKPVEFDPSIPAAIVRKLEIQPSAQHIPWGSFESARLINGGGIVDNSGEETIWEVKIVGCDSRGFTRTVSLFVCNNPEFPECQSSFTRLFEMNSHQESSTHYHGNRNI